MEITFEKMQGIGNDFIVIEDFQQTIALTPEQVVFLCDRNFGIGADGIILLRPARHPDADFEWLFANSDGSFSEMCGNGIRCAARFLHERGYLPSEAPGVVIDTGAGQKYVEIVCDEADVFEYAIVDMGCADLSPAALACTLEPNTSLDIEYTLDREGAGETDTLTVEGIIDYPLSLEEGDEEVILTGVSMGNPHCVIDVDTLGCSIHDAPVRILGPCIETLSVFKNRTNVEFIEVIDDHTIEVRTWERGCGETLACGTGACAATVCAFLQGRVHGTVTVRLAGGSLRISVNPENLQVKMAGPAEFVYAGTIALDE